MSRLNGDSRHDECIELINLQAAKCTADTARKNAKTALITMVISLIAFLTAAMTLANTYKAHAISPSEAAPKTPVVPEQGSSTKPKTENKVAKYRKPKLAKCRCKYRNTIASRAPQNYHRVQPQKSAKTIRNKTRRHASISDGIRSVIWTSLVAKMRMAVALG